MVRPNIDEDWPKYIRAKELKIFKLYFTDHEMKFLKELINHLDNSVLPDKWYGKMANLKAKVETAIKEWVF